MIVMHKHRGKSMLHAHSRARNYQVVYYFFCTWYSKQYITLALPLVQAEIYSSQASSLQPYLYSATILR